MTLAYYLHGWSPEYISQVFGSAERRWESRVVIVLFFLSLFLSILPLKYTYSVLPKYVYLQKSHFYAEGRCTIQAAHDIPWGTFVLTYSVSP